MRFGHVTRRPALSGNVRGLLIVCGAELILFSFIFGIGWLASRASREELLFRWRPGWWVVPLGIVYSVGIRLAAAVVVLIVSGILLVARVESPQQLQHSYSANRPNIERLVNVSSLRNDPTYFWLTITLVSFVVAGLREEVWRAGALAGMRALWPRLFSSRRGELAAVSILALVFGAGHLPLGAVAAAIAGLLGLFLGMIMVLHRSIWPAVIAHGFFDATTMALLPFALEKLQQLR